MTTSIKHGVLALALAAGGWLAVPAAQELTLPVKPDSVRFAVIGDNGTGEPPQYEVGAQMAAFHQKFPFSFVIMMGDNLYGSERPQDFVTKFEAPYKLLLDAKVTFHASLGNHDDPNQRFYTPFNMSGKRYYTFKKGNARFFALDSVYMDPVQLAWLEGELKNSGSDWKIAYFHHPLYSSGMHGSQTDLRALLEPLFLKYGVNVVFSGHEHFYQHIKPQKGIHYFVSGAAGQLRAGDIKPSPLTAVGFDSDRSFMLIEVAGNELSFQAISRTGKTVDKGTILMRDPVPTGAAAAVAEKKLDQEGVIWRDPGPVGSLNLIDGAGGRAHAPNPKGAFTFIEEAADGTSPKFDIVDDHGVVWKVKLGEESESETAAARLMWAAGYFVDEDYFVPELVVAGLPTLHRGQEFVSTGGTVHRARLERKFKDVKRSETWDWFANPFIDSPELNGLRIMMSLLNNWDLKEINNTVLEIGGERRYMVADLGASFGNTGNMLTRSKSAPQEYADSKFVESTSPGFADFVLHSRPFILSAINVPNYKTRTHMEDVARKIPRADAKWLGHRLALLSLRQLDDAFQAAGYTPDEVALYVSAVQKRIAELNAM